MGYKVVGETITNRLPTVEELRSSSGFQALPESEQLRAIDELRKARGERLEGDTGFIGKAKDRIQNWGRPDRVHDLPDLPTPEELQKSEGFQLLPLEEQQKALQKLIEQRRSRTNLAPLWQRGLAESQQQLEEAAFHMKDSQREPYSRYGEASSIAGQHGVEIKNIHDAVRVLNAYDEIRNDEALPGSLTESLAGLLGIPYFLLEQLAKKVTSTPLKGAGGYTGMGRSPLPDPEMQGSRLYKDIQDNSPVNKAIGALLGALGSNKYISDMLGQLGIDLKKPSDAEEWAREVLLKGD